MIKKKVIELIRVSTEGQASADKAGIPAQRASNRRTAEAHNLQIVRTIEMSDVSGAAVLHAPEMKQLLSLMSSNEVHGVVAKEFSRLMRPDSFEDFILLDAFARTNTVLYLPDGPIDFTSKSGRILGTLRAVMAGIERTEILERVFAAKEEKRRAGKHAQSYVALPYGVGYDRPNERWYYTADAARIADAFRLVLEGETSYVALGRKVGLKPINLRNYLRNPIYTGWRVYNQRRDPSPQAMAVRSDGRQGDRKKIARPEDEVIKVRVLDPLVSEEEFRRVQQILNLKREAHWRGKPNHERRFGFSGFLRCGTCGNLIYSHANRKHDWYVCKSRCWPQNRMRQKSGLPNCTNRYMQRERAEHSIEAVLADKLVDRGFLDRVASEYFRRNNPDAGGRVLQQSKQRIRDLEKREERLIEIFLAGAISRPEFDRRLESFRQENRYHKAKISEAQNRAVIVSPQELARSFAPFKEFRFLSREQKRRLVQAVIPEIHIENYRVTKLAWLSPLSDHHEMNHTGTDSSPPPA